MSEPVDTSAVRAYTNIETAFHDGLWIRESDYDRLQSALTAAHQRLSEQETLLAERNRDVVRALAHAHGGLSFARKACPNLVGDFDAIVAALNAAMGAKEGK